MYWRPGIQRQNSHSLLTWYTPREIGEVLFNWRTIIAAIAISAISLPVFAQRPDLPVNVLVRRVVNNELAAANNKTHRFMFRSHRVTGNLDQEKLYVDTKEAMAGMVTAWNSQPLTPELRKAENDRLNRMLSDPEELRHKQKQERENADRIQRIIRAMPDAFLFEYDGTETGTASVGHPGMELVRVKFRPNPNYEPPSRVEQVLTGMQGTVLVDPKSARFARIDGTLFRDVAFGWGILGHLDKGGQLRAEQVEYSPGIWVPSSMSLRFTGKLLLFKSLNYKSEESFRDFRPVPSDLTFAQGIELLKKENSAVAQNLPAKTGY